MFLLESNSMTDLKRRNEFSQRFKRQIAPVLQLTAAYDALMLAHVDAQILDNHLGELDQHIGTSLSRSLLVSYAKPFLSNIEDDAFASMSSKYLKTHDEFDIRVHNALLELRNNLVAHANKSFEKADARILASPVNSDSGNPKVKRAFLPFMFYYKNASFMGFTDADTVAKIEKHIGLCLRLTMLEIQRKTQELRDFMVEYADVCDRDDRVTLHEHDQYVPDLSNRDIFPDEIPKLKIGKNAVTFRNCLLQVPVALNIDYDSEHFSIKGAQSDDGKAEVTVSFKNC